MGPPRRARPFSLLQVVAEGLRGWGWPVFRRERAKISFVISRGRGEISRKFREIFEISLNFNSHFRRNLDEISTKFRNFEIFANFYYDFVEITSKFPRG